MFPLRSLTIVILLVVLIQATEGNYRVITATHDQWISGDDDFSNSSSGSGYDPLYYCMDDGNCSCIYSLDQALDNLTSNVLINITTDVELSSIIPFIDLTNITITGHNSPTVNCSNSGSFQFVSCNIIKIKGINFDGCGSKSDNNFAGSVAINFTNSATVEIQNCSFQHSTGQIVLLSEVSGQVHINNCRFVNNKPYLSYKHGSIICHSSSSTIPSITMLSIANCYFEDNSAIAGGYDSLIYSASLQQHHQYLSLENSTFINNRNYKIIQISNITFHMYGNIMFTTNDHGIFLEARFSNVSFKENSEVVYTTENSIVHITYRDKTILTLDDYSSVMFKGNSTVTFVSNSDFYYGRAIHLQVYGSIVFEGNSKVTFFNNETYFNGGAIYLQDHSSVVFEGNSKVTFFNNKAYFNGGAIFLQDHSSVTFKGNSMVIFDNNDDNYYGGAVIYLQDYCNVTFRENSLVTFENNNATAISLQNHSNVRFKENSRVTFNKNIVRLFGNGGAIYLHDHSSVTFKDNSTISFENNYVLSNGGAISLQFFSELTFEGISRVSFNNNNAYHGCGGAIYLEDHSNVIFKENSIVKFVGNWTYRERQHHEKGGALCLKYHSSVIFKESSRVTFVNNTASKSGGAVYLQQHCSLIFEGNSMTVFIKNYNNKLFVEGTQYGGGAIGLQNHSKLIFKNNCTVIFDSNDAITHGGVIFSTLHSDIIFSGYSTVTFSSNSAYSNGGALYVKRCSNVIFDNNTEILFINNRAGHDGGAIHLYIKSCISFKGNSSVTFTNNHAASNGGAFYCQFTILFSENASVTFTKNNAGKYGGAVFLFDKFNVTFNKAQVNFINNSADIGGAILAETQHDVTVYFDITASGLIVFYNNIARLWSHQSVIFSTDAANISKHLLGINKSEIQQRGLAEHIATIPCKLVLQDPAIVCTELKNDTNCTSYQVNDVMLGQVVTISGCVYDCFDNPVTISTLFKVDSAMTEEQYNADVLHEVVIACQSTQGFDISITGNKTINNDLSFIYSVMLASSTPLPQWRPISLKLSIQLSPCHLGFQHSNESQKCECYSENDIVICSGSTSIIKRGYWFGTVTEKGTVAICPINYCDFSCCETDNGYHQLSPERENQCAAHRTGIACGNCEEGYTLSYSADCVSVNKCTVGWTVLVVTLTVFYWMVIVIAVFAMMYYKLPTGYLYAITYYYSMIDILLGQDLYHFSSLRTTVTIISSIFKLSPQFLGSLCLVKGLSGIDIQFIHYIHPSAVSIILVIISLSAKCSRRLSAFISRGKIHVICFLLLLSYTSVAFTSLLLVRSLTFHNVDKIFTYLSPDIEYLHGRHLAYFIVAVLCTIIIVIGLPLLLLLEPFLNHKINFTRIKPLLDQFQGCYKDQYRWFAAYYMICRLVLIAIVVYSPDYFITQYALIIVCVIVALVHITVKPYNEMFLNALDGFVLDLLIIVVFLQTFTYFGSFINVAIAFTLIILPIATIIVMGLKTCKVPSRKFITKCFRSRNDQDTVAIELPMEEFDITVDDSMRKNATICDINQLEKEQDATKECFKEALTVNDDHQSSAFSEQML